MNRFGLWSLAILFLLLAGCEGNERAPSGAIPVFNVADTFSVGSGVFVRSLAVDGAAGSLWVGTSAGVHEVRLADQSIVNTFTRDHGLANEYVFGIGIDSEGAKWFGTNAGGVSRYRNGQWKTFFPMHGLADYWVYSFANDRNGDLWIGTWAGVNRVDLKTEAFKTYVKELVNEWVYGISVDSSGNVWFGTEGGVSMFDGTSWKSWTHAEGIGAANDGRAPPSSNTGLGTRSRHDLGILSGGGATYNPGYVFSILATPDGSVWAGTWGGGVSRFDGTRWTSMTTANGLAGDVVYAIVRDPSDGALWLGTNRGISRFDGREWQVIGAAQGLPAQDVYALAIAPSGDLWVGMRGMAARLVRQVK